MAMIPCAAMIAFQENSVLLVKHGLAAHHVLGVYGLPSGKISPQETPQQAAIREFEEETGLTAKIVTDFPDNFYTAQITMKDGSSHTYPWTVFLAQEYQGQLRTTEETEPAWINIAQIDTYPLLPNVKTAVFAAQKFLQNKQLN